MNAVPARRNHPVTSMKIGILGGTFDPIHEGHLRIAESARECLRLDKVIFIPAGRPWLKSGQSVTESVHRLAMVELAIEDNPHFEVSRIETERPGPTYTVDTLTELRRRMGDAGLYLILGMDSVRDLRRWHRPERIFELCSVVAVSRPGVADVSVGDLERVFPSSAGRVRMIGGPMVDTNSTDIRLRAGEVESLRGIPDSVRAYIAKHGLYSDSN
ncbi:MAG: nicotinate-nucleotide adenylyltransferase [Dehalococcoidia bacterium]|nr:nicotinate-nucleotide adenylyltransferase [Dehalococcoidia bacterium]